ncbi:MAG: hypothetical protein V2I33_23010 [Kangiellaceae bacterium]|jgi:hypothetical protein|nr:hypothetical protein [Kangiellaceae bacterium]
MAARQPEHGLTLTLRTNSMGHVNPAKGTFRSRLLTIVMDVDIPQVKFVHHLSDNSVIDVLLDVGELFEVLP